MRSPKDDSTPKALTDSKSACGWTVEDARWLHDATGAGLHDCRSALTWAKGDADLATWYLKNFGHAVVRICTRCGERFRFPNVKRAENGAVIHDC